MRIVFRVAMMAGALTLGACGTVSRGTEAVTSFFSADGGEQAASAPVRARGRGWRGSQDEVIGMSAQEVETAFGEPSFVRQEKPAEVWQYRQADCIVDIFLYTDDRDETFRVAHLELRSADPGVALSERGRQACFDDLAHA